MVYQERTAFVAELIQNAQRAKSNNIWITVDEGYFAIKDDGGGCSNPEQVFTLDLSGWGADVHAPFGEGFSSVFAIADYIVVRSKDWLATLNLKKSIESNDFSNIVVQSTPKQPGFQVQVSYDPSFPKEEIEQQVKKIGAMIPTTTWLNGQKIGKTMIEYEPFSIKRRLRDFGQAIVAPSRGYSLVEILYEGRPVCEKYFGGLKGLLALRPGAVTLKAPDRRDIVRDDKYWALTRRMEQLSQEVMSILVQDYADQISTYSQTIQEILSPSQYARHLTYGLKDTQLFPKKQQPFSRQHCIAKLSENEEFTQQPFKHVNVPAKPTPIRNYIDEASEIKEIRRLVRRGKIFYRLESEQELEKLQGKVEYYGFIVLVVDKLHAKALDWLKVPHLNTSSYTIEETYKFNNVGARSNKERRLLALLRPIEKHYNLPAETFTFANIKSIVKTQIGDKTVNRSTNHPYGACYKYGLQTRIVLSRKQLKIRQLPGSYNTKLGTAKDLKALIMMLPTIAHELAHLVHNTTDNTLDHHRAIGAIQHQLATIINKAF